MKWFTKNNEIFENFKNDKTARLAVGLSFFMLVLCTGLFLLTLKRLPPQVPLFYSLPWGEQQLAPAPALLFLLFGVFLIAVLNSFFIVTALKSYPLAVKILILASVAIIFLASITLIKIIFLIL